MLWQSYKWLSSSTTVVQILPTIWDSYQNNASCRTDKNKEWPSLTLIDCSSWQEVRNNPFCSNAIFIALNTILENKVRVSSQSKGIFQNKLLISSRKNIVNSSTALTLFSLFCFLPFFMLLLSYCCPQTALKWRKFHRTPANFRWHHQVQTRVSQLHFLTT